MKLSEVGKMKLSQIEESPSALSVGRNTGALGIGGPAIDQPMGVLSEAIDTITGGGARNALRNPMQFALGGPVASQYKSGARFGARIRGVELKGKESNLANKFLPEPKGLPATLTGMALGGGMTELMAIPKLKNVNRARKSLQAARDESSKLLQVPTGRMAMFERKLKETPEIAEIAKLAQPRTSYRGVIKDVLAGIAKYGKQKRAILASDNFDLTHEFPEELLNKLPKKVRATLEIPESGKITRLQAQDLKERIGDELKGFYTRARKDALTTEDKFYRADLADYVDSLRGKINAGNEELKALDATYGGMKEADYDLGVQSSLERKSDKPSKARKMLGHIRMIFGSEKPHPFVSSEVLDQSKGVLKRTMSIQKKYQDYLDRLPDVKSYESKNTLPVLKYPNRIPRKMGLPEPEPISSPEVRESFGSLMPQIAYKQPLALPQPNPMSVLSPGIERKTLNLKDVSKRKALLDLLKRSENPFRGTIRYEQ